MGRGVATKREVRSDTVRAVELVSEVSSVPRARHLVADDLANAGLPPVVVENALIVTTELVTNAVLHAQPLDLDVRDVIVLRWSVVGDDVLIAVSDGGGSDRPHLRQPTSAEDEGRGLSIVDAVARTWEVRSEPGRVTVHAVVGPWEPSA